MTVSFHKYGDNFFPGTGDIKDVGERNGRFYSLNVPLRNGMDDVTFSELFKPVMSRVMEVFKPGAIVLQCGESSTVSRMTISEYSLPSGSCERQRGSHSC